MEFPKSGAQQYSFPLDIYKTKLEKLLNSIILVSDVAELSAAAIDLPRPDGRRSGADTRPISNRKSGLDYVQWSSLRFEDRKKIKDASRYVMEGSEESNSDEEESAESDSYTSENIDIRDRRKQDRGDGTESDNFTSANIEMDGRKQDKCNQDVEKNFNRMRTQPSFSHSSSGSVDTGVKHFKIKNQLGRWDDPLNKLDTVSCHDSVTSNLPEFISPAMTHKFVAITIFSFRHSEVSKGADIYGPRTPILRIVWASSDQG